LTAPQAVPSRTSKRRWAKDQDPNKRLAVTVPTRNTAGYRDPAVIAIDLMKEIYIDGTLEPIRPQLVPQSDPQRLHGWRQHQRDRGC
jgi:hypothetical protein